MGAKHIVPAVTVVLGVLLAGLIIGGALGNLADRILLGFVVDFVDLRIWPVFNVADVAIVAGAITAAIYFWRMADQHELDALQGKEMAENGG